MLPIFDLFSHVKNNVVTTYRPKLYNHYQKQVNFVGYCTVSTLDRVKK